MPWLSEIAAWISSHESLFSGLAAMIVVAGVLFSPLAAWRRRRTHDGSAPANAPRDAAEASARPPAASAKPAVSDARPLRLTLQDLTKPAPVETRFAHSDGVRIAYNVQGSGPHTIVVAPGIFSHLNVMANLPSSRGTLEALTRFARVVCFDKRGQGLSDPTLSVPNLEERTRDIEAVMDAAGVERALLLGFSEGGPMCLSFAHAHPDRVQGLVIVGSTASWLQRPGFPIGISQRALASVAESWGTGALRDIFFPGVSREQLDDDTYRAVERLIGNRSAARQLVAMMLETDVRPILSGISTPALIIHFAGDLAVPIRLGRALAEGLPDAEFLEVNAVDHADLSRSPEAIERIRAFCERTAGAQPLARAAP